MGQKTSNFVQFINFAVLSTSLYQISQYAAEDITLILMSTGKTIY
jgi:hypothetical protein